MVSNISILGCEKARYTYYAVYIFINTTDDLPFVHHATGCPGCKHKTGRMQMESHCTAGNSTERQTKTWIFLLECLNKCHLQIIFATSIFGNRRVFPTWLCRCPSTPARNIIHYSKSQQPKLAFFSPPATI